MKGRHVTALLGFALASSWTDSARASSDVRGVVLLRQGVTFQFGNTVLSGGAGGGVGAELTFGDRYVLSADFNLWWLLGNAYSLRTFAGVQRDGDYAPAGWLGITLLAGDKLELLAQDGSQRPAPGVALGLRGSPLRWVADQGSISLLEPGLSVDLHGGWVVDCTLIAAGASW